MAIERRSKCPRCGIWQEAAPAASEAQVWGCENCGAVTRGQLEYPEPLCAELLSLISLVLAFAGAFICCFAALRFAVFVVLALGSLFFLLVTIFLEHKKSRSNRLKLWNHLIKTYAGLAQEAKRPAAERGTGSPSPDCKEGGSGAE
ncbi:MAG: hypothetical protein WC708_05285 [Lentisphaeria bacterium]